MAHPSGGENTKNDDRTWQRERHEVGAKVFNDWKVASGFVNASNMQGKRQNNNEFSLWCLLKTDFKIIRRLLILALLKTGFSITLFSGDYNKVKCQT